MLTSRTAEDVSALIAKLDEARTLLVALKTEMISPGPKKIELNYEKAEEFANHLIGWAGRAKGKHRKLQLDGKLGEAAHKVMED